MSDPGRVRHRPREDAVMGHRAVGDDPTPDGDVQIGVGIVQHRAAVAGDERIDAKAKDQRQGEAVTAAAK